MLIAMGNLCCCMKKKKHKRIVLLLVGLDNAGKSVAVKGLAGEPLDTVVPTVGLSVVNLNYNDYNVKIFDLGGGSNIRGIWQRYFVDAHGVIFVVDSSDHLRLDEVRDVLDELLSNDKISGKPVLLLANKQDQQEALDEIDLVDQLQLESLVNRRRCPTLVESCSATDISKKRKIDPGIQKGYHWLLNYIVRDYQNLNARVVEDVKQQEVQDQQTRLEKIERLKKLKETAKREEDVIESYSDYNRKLNGDVQNSSRNSFDDQKELFVVHRMYTNGDVVSSSSKSNESFPRTYFEHIIEKGESPQPERPKSAVQLIKEHLQLENVHQQSKRQPLMSFVSNKTAPANLYGVRHPLSAGARRKHFTNDRRALKSAGEPIFAVNMPNTVLYDTQEARELFNLNNFQGIKKVSPFKTNRSEGDEQRWALKSPKNHSIISTIDI